MGLVESTAQARACAATMCLCRLGGEAPVPLALPAHCEKIVVTIETVSASVSVTWRPRCAAEMPDAPLTNNVICTVIPVLLGRQALPLVLCCGDATCLVVFRAALFSSRWLRRERGCNTGSKPSEGMPSNRPTRLDGLGSGRSSGCVRVDERCFGLGCAAATA